MTSNLKTLPRAEATTEAVVWLLQNKDSCLVVPRSVLVATYEMVRDAAIAAKADVVVSNTTYTIRYSTSYTDGQISIVADDSLHLIRGMNRQTHCYLDPASRSDDLYILDRFR